MGNKKGKKDFNITQKEVGLAIALAALGFVFSAREFLLFLDKQTPLAGLLIYYLVLGTTIYALSHFELVVLGAKIKNLEQVTGLVLITFAFFIVVGWSSGYVQLVTGHAVESVSNVFYQCEDGAVWDLWYNIVGIRDVETARLLAFAVTPFGLALLGGYFATKKPKLLR